MCVCVCVCVCVGRDSSEGIANRYGRTGRDRVPVGARFSSTWIPLSLLYNEYWVFPGDKTAGAWC